MRWPARYNKQQLLLPLVTTTRKKKRFVAAPLATKSARNSLIYGDLRLPPPPHLQLRPPELDEAEKENKPVPDPADEICHFPPGMSAIRHIGPETTPKSTPNYSGAISPPTPADYSGGEDEGEVR
jgi:hypothetical protein